MDGEGVIFLGGCMRSGTTLLQRMLCASPQMHRLIEECQFLTALLNLHEDWRRRFDWLREFYGTPERFEAYARSTVDGFLRATFATLAPTRAIVLKNPELTLHFPTLAAWYERARFVVMVRDPRDTIASILDVAGRHDEAGINRSRLVQMGRDMAELSRFYKSYYAGPLQSPKTMGRVAVIRYEDVVSRPQEAIAALSRLLGIELGIDRMPVDSFEGRNRDAYSSAFWTRLRTEPPSVDSVGRHRRSLSADEIAAIERHCADFNRAFPYW